MVGYQFAHLEAYSRKALIKKNDKENKAHKWSTREVFAEASREAGSCSHVANPSPPVLVYGQSLEATEQEHDARCSIAVDTMKNGKTRKIRETQNTLLTVVLSHPDSEYSADVQEWEKLSIDWLKGQYGDQLKTVVRHDDEGHQHLHVYIIPDDLKAIGLHPGERLKQQAKEEGKDKKQQNNAYKSGFREWQNSYWQNVGMPCGLARIGPGKRRLSREAWKAEQQQSEALRDVNIEAEKIKKTAEDRGFQVGQHKAVEQWNGYNPLGKMLISASVKAFDLKKIGSDETAEKANKSIQKWKKENKRLSEKVANLKQQFDSMKNEYEEVLQQKDKPFRDLQKSQQMTQNILEQLVNHCIDNNFNPSKQFKLIMSQEELDKLNKEIVKQFMDDLTQIFGNDNNKTIKNGFSRF